MTNQRLLIIVSEQTEREIAKETIVRIPIATAKETDQMHIYQNGRYIHERFDSTIKQIIKEITNETIIKISNKQTKKYHLSLAKQNMIINFIKSFTYCSLDDFDSNERIMNLKNGLYYLDGYEGILPNPKTEDGHYDTKNDDNLIKGIK